mgnify:CR=1 FL=1
MATSTLKGICRNVLGGAEGSLVQVFETLSRPGSPFLRQDDAFLNAAQWWVPLPEDEGEGGWRLAAGSLCFPSSWSLVEKFGKPLQDIHAPVPGFGPGTRSAGAE